MQKSKSILMISRYYYPFFQGGGPVKSTKNFIKFNSSQYIIKLFTSRESLNGVKNFNPEQNVYYLSFLELFLNLVVEVFFKRKTDIIYINSFFNSYSLISILICFFSNSDLYIHSRGVLKEAQLNHKKNKKLLYINFLNFFSKKYTFLFNEINEKETIKKYFSKPKFKFAYNYVDKPRSKITNSNNRFIFFSRISPEKGLMLLLEAIKKSTEKIELDIYGNIWDKDYYKKCQKLITTNGISEITFKGPILPENLNNVVSKYHCLVLPTRGENFGHVIYESLKNSIPVISSDNVPWNLEKYGCGKNLKLNSDLFLNAMLSYKNMGYKDYRNQKINALRYSMEYYKNQKYFS